ncbi:hypothetical protein [uncultured Paracoccus sp.]|uniref:hypothetical protein n=1 Tax=uncultured Paracoccus sp. TaxID=189685 RepID=UPI00262650B0|nr:hypothetical protein [uncultured Paracoccus sp.]
MSQPRHLSISFQSPQEMAEELRKEGCSEEQIKNMLGDLANRMQDLLNSMEETNPILAERKASPGLGKDNYRGS